MFMRRDVECRDCESVDDSTVVASLGVICVVRDVSR